MASHNDFCQYRGECSAVEPQGDHPGYLHLFSGASRFLSVVVPVCGVGYNNRIQIIATLAVGLRLYARFKVIHSPGWDDAFVCLALVREKDVPAECNGI